MDIANFSPNSSPVLIAAANNRSAGTGINDVSYKLFYYKLIGVAATTRVLLALSGARWENVYATDWVNIEKKNAPLGVMPLLYETHHNKLVAADDEASEPQQPVTLEIPESEVIERYLAKKYGFLGPKDDPWAATAIEVFYTSSKAISTYFVTRVLQAFPENRAKEMEKFLTVDIPNWVAQHEKWLAKNGFNGHYVGNELSLADIRAFTNVDRFLWIPECQEIFSKEKTPGLWAVKEAVEAQPRFAAWRASEECREIEASSAERLKAFAIPK